MPPVCSPCPAESLSVLLRSRMVSLLERETKSLQNSKALLMRGSPLFDPGQKQNTFCQRQRKMKEKLLSDLNRSAKSIY